LLYRLEVVINISKVAGRNGISSYGSKVT
jgi:hypothetical protein